MYDENVGPLLLIECTVNALIRLGERPGRSESLLCDLNSLCWFCLVMVQILYIRKFLRELYFRETLHMRSFVKIKP